MSLHEEYFSHPWDFALSPLIIISSVISNGTLKDDFLVKALAVEPGNKKWRLEGIETKPVHNKLWIKTASFETVESPAPGKLSFGLLLVCLQKLKLAKQAHLCFLCCRKRSPILTTVLFVLRGTSPTISSGSCPAGEWLAACFWLGPLWFRPAWPSPARSICPNTAGVQEETTSTMIHLVWPFSMETFCLVKLTLFSHPLHTKLKLCDLEPHEAQLDHLAPSSGFS